MCPFLLSRVADKQEFVGHIREPVSKYCSGVLAYFSHDIELPNKLCYQSLFMDESEIDEELVQFQRRISSASYAIISFLGGIY